MSNPPQNNFPLPKDSYAAFDAISLRNLILKRLDEQGLFTDHNYLGSNLASVIDIISFAYNTLIFYLNKTSNETMFTEAQLYENINRIVKLLDYKPIGFQTSTVSFSVSANDLQKGFYSIPRYAYITVVDIPFCFNEDLTFSLKQDLTTISNFELTELTNKKLLYQGFFRENPVHIAAGEKNEVVVVRTQKELVDHANVHVYVYEGENEKWYKYEEVSVLIGTNAASRVFEKRYSPSGDYELTFGDGINGKKLSSQDRVAVYYLQSSGLNAVVGPGALQETRGFKDLLRSPQYQQILADTGTAGATYLTVEQFAKFRIGNEAGSTVPKAADTADEIRKKAPSYFKSQYRLVTKSDYESFIKNNFETIVNDVKVFDNWEYTGQYLKYFYDIQVNPTGVRQLMFNQIQFADSCNFNNIYVCATPKVGEGSSFKYLLPALKENIITNIQSLKTITSEITFLDPVYKAVNIGVRASEELGILEPDFTQLEIIKSPRSKRSSQLIASDVYETITSFFDLKTAKLGAMLDYNSLVSKIMNIEGVFKIQTRKIDTQEVYDGLSLFVWNPNYPDFDYETVVNNKETRPFELLFFNDVENFVSKIQVLEE